MAFCDTGKHIPRPCWRKVFVKKTKTTPLEGSARTPKAPESGNVHWAIIYNNSRSCENMQIAKFTFKYILALAQFVIRVWWIFQYFTLRMSHKEKHLQFSCHGMLFTLFDNTLYINVVSERLEVSVSTQKVRKIMSTLGVSCHIRYKSISIFMRIKIWIKLGYSSVYFFP